MDRVPISPGYSRTTRPARQASWHRILDLINCKHPTFYPGPSGDAPGWRPTLRGGPEDTLHTCENQVAALCEPPAKFSGLAATDNDDGGSTVPEGACALKTSWGACGSPTICCADGTSVVHADLKPTAACLIAIRQWHPLAMKAHLQQLVYSKEAKTDQLKDATYFVWGKTAGANMTRPRRESIVAGRDSMDSMERASMTKPLRIYPTTA
ncbi:hypothetical protein CMUS01_08762 [Colletotrichum musicola]|uniref:Uncharacterized protein n=1 Tax=Colletotrichum musicola TaxID=2175873 RepID=A0A8H6NCX4_9PEZI|nr:hypothetical protein CMUS01_08762 [Colletotrichum musicola]